MVIATAIGAALWLVALALQSVKPMLFAFTVPVAYMVILVIWNLGEMRLRKQIRQASHLLCEGCLYDLRSSPSAGACPECGFRYQRDELIRMWRDWDRPLRDRRND